MADPNAIPVESAPAPVAPEVAPAVIRTEPGHIAVTGKDGKVSALPEQNLGAAQAAGFRPATSAEVTNARLGSFGPVASGLLEGARTATFGLSDVLAIEGDRLIEGDAEAEKMRRVAREMREVNPGANVAGMIGGSLAPLMFGSPTAAVGAVEAGGSLLARAGARAVAAAPRAIIEGAAIGAGQQLSEDILGNHELVAGKYLAAGLKGGVIGVLAAGTLSAGLGAIGDKLALRSEGAITRGADQGIYRSAGELSESLTGKPIMGRLSTFAEEQAAKGAMPSASLAGSEMQKLGTTAEAQQARIRRIGRTLLDEGITTPGASKAIQAERLTARASEAGSELGRLRKSFEAATVRPSVETVAQRINAEVLDPLVATPFSGHIQQAVAPIVSELVERMGGKVVGTGEIAFERSTFKTFDELFQLRKALDPHLKWDRGLPPPTPALEQLRSIRRILEEEFEGAAERAAEELGEQTASKYKVTKALYADLKTAEKWATKGAARDAQNRAVSLTDTIMGGAALASGHPLALLAPVGNKLLRTYGNQVAASLADRATKIASLQEAAAKFDTKLESSVAAFFGKGKAPPAKRLEPVSPETARAIREAVRNPAALTEKVSEAMGVTGMREYAPKTAQAAALTIMRAANYVRSAMPAEPKPQGVAFGIQKPRPLGLKEQMRVDQAVHALDADAVLDDIARGHIDRQRIEAIRIINPPLFAAIQGAVRQYGIANQPEITTQREVAMRIIFGTPVSTLTAPSTVHGFQKAFDTAAAPQQAPQGRPMNPARPTGHATAFDRMERGDA